MRRPTAFLRKLSYPLGALLVVGALAGGLLLASRAVSARPAVTAEAAPLLAGVPVAADAPGPAVGALVPAPAVAAQAPREIWKPALVTSWQWQLEPRNQLDQSFDVEMYDIDLFYHDASVVAALKARGRKVVCYMSAGSWENWRPDADRFPREVRGRRNGWHGEVWLDVRRIDVLGPIMEARLDLCRAKGFDGVEPDNVDGYSNNSGFPLTADDQLRYNRFIAEAAHARGLSVGLKNDLEQVRELLPYFDWALNEQCFENDDCHLLLPFIQAGKAVFNVEYELDTDEFCDEANALNFNSLKKNLGLDAYREACR